MFSQQQSTQDLGVPRHALQIKAALIRIRDVVAAGSSSESSVYRDVAAELLPPPIRLSPRCSRWVASEVEAVLAARIAGKTPDEIRLLVRQLVADRSKASA